jgi:hypothetical protein
MCTRPALQARGWPGCTVYTLVNSSAAAWKPTPHASDIQIACGLHLPLRHHQCASMPPMLGDCDELVIQLTADCALKPLLQPKKTRTCILCCLQHALATSYATTIAPSHQSVGASYTDSKSTQHHTPTASCSVSVLQQGQALLALLLTLRLCAGASPDKHLTCTAGRRTRQQGRCSTQTAASRAEQESTRLQQKYARALPATHAKEHVSVKGCDCKTSVSCKTTERGACIVHPRDRHSYSAA